MTNMKTNFFAKFHRVLIILLSALFITFFVYGCSVFKKSSKNPDKTKNEKKENTKRKPPIKRNLLE